MKKDNSYKKTFEGSKKALKQYYENTYLEKVSDVFGLFDSLEIGRQMEHIAGFAIIHKKRNNTYLLFSKTREAMINEYKIKPLHLIQQ